MAINPFSKSDDPQNAELTDGQPAEQVDKGAETAPSSATEPPVANKGGQQGGNGRTRSNNGGGRPRRVNADKIIERFERSAADLVAKMRKLADDVEASLTVEDAAMKPSDFARRADAITVGYRSAHELQANARSARKDEERASGHELMDYLMAQGGVDVQKAVAAMRDGRPIEEVLGAIARNEAADAAG